MAMGMHSANQRPFVPGLWHGRASTPEQSDETDEYSDDGFDSDYDDSGNELHQPENLNFEVGDRVWICVKNIWYNGIVRHITPPEETKEGRCMYNVYFKGKNGRTNMRMPVHPLDGTVKRDIPYIRNLLIACGARIGSPGNALQNNVAAKCGQVF